MLDGTEWFDCKCGMAEHSLRFVLDESENEIYTEVYLRQWRNIFKRIWIAVEYIFGLRHQYGHFDCFLLDSKDAARLIGMLEKIKEQK